MRRRVPTASLLAATALLLWAPACSTRAAGQPDGGVANQPDGGKASQPDGGKASQPDGGEAGQPDGGEEICEGGPDAACACNDLPCPGVTYVEAVIPPFTSTDASPDGRYALIQVDTSGVTPNDAGSDSQFAIEISGSVVQEVSCYGSEIARGTYTFVPQKYNNVLMQPTCSSGEPGLLLGPCSSDPAWSIGYAVGPSGLVIGCDHEGYGSTYNFERLP
jgi:hypothetical protein